MPHKTDKDVPSCLALGRLVVGDPRQDINVGEFYSLSGLTFPHVFEDCFSRRYLARLGL